MTSLTELAQGAHTPAQPFNANFYIAAVTVIPVLYLALTVQGPTAVGLFKAAVASDGKSPQIVSFVLVAIPTFVYVLGGVGEFAGLSALYHQSENEWTFTTDWALVLLTLVAVVAPAITAIREARGSGIARVGEGSQPRLRAPVRNKAAQRALRRPPRAG